MTVKNGALRGVDLAAVSRTIQNALSGQLGAATSAQASTDFAGVVTSLTPRLLHPDHLANKAIVEVIETMAHTLGPEVFKRQQTAIMGRIDSRPFLPAIRCPSLVLCGREDLLTPVELHEEMAAGIPGAKLVVVEHCGHMSALEQAQQVNTALQNWLSALPG